MGKCISVVFALLFSCVAAGCAGTGDTLDDAVLAADLLIVKTEFQSSLETLDTVAWSEDERAVVDASLDTILSTYARVKDYDVPTLVNLVSQPGQGFSQVVLAYTDIRRAYESYLFRTGTAPNVQLELYDEAVRNGYMHLQEQLTSSQSEIDLSLVRELAKFILRGYVLYNA